MFETAIESIILLKLPKGASVMVYETGRAIHRQRQRLALHVVVAQHQLRDFLSHFPK